MVGRGSLSLLVALSFLVTGLATLDAGGPEGPAISVGVRAEAKRRKRRKRRRRRALNPWQRMRRAWDSGVKRARKWAKGVKRRFQAAASRTRKAVAKATANARKFFKRVGDQARKAHQAFVKKAQQNWKNFKAQAAKNWDRFKKWAADTHKKFVANMKKGWKFFQEKVRPILCNILPICPIIDIIKNAVTAVRLIVKHGWKKGLEKIWSNMVVKPLKKLGERLKKKAMKAVTDFKSVLLLKNPSPAKLGKACLMYVPKLTRSLKNLFAEVFRFLGIPGFLAEALAWAGAAPLAGTAATVFIPIAWINFGVKKLVGWLLPKIILGVGTVFNAANANKHVRGFANFAKTVVSFALKLFPAAGAISKLFKPEVQKKMRAVFKQIANVSGKIQKGINGALKIAAAARSGSFGDLEAALAARKAVSGTLSKLELGKMIDALVDFGEEQIWLAVEPPLRKILGKLIGLLNKLLDIPRNALVAAVGTIPFAGGVLAAALNFGLGVLVDMLDNLLLDQISGLAHDVLKNAMGDLKIALRSELLRSKANRAKTQGFLKLAKSIADVAGEVKTAMGAASRGLQGTIGSLVTSALRDVILRGIPHEGLRNLIASAVGSFAEQVATRKLTLREALVQVIKKVAPEVVKLLAGFIPDPGLRGLVQRGLTSLLGALDGTKAGTFAKNPMGFLKGLALQLFRDLKDQLITFLLGKLKSSREAVLQIVGRLGTVIQQEGFAALLRGSTWAMLLGGG